MLTCKNCDNGIRWKEGERLEDLFEQRCDQLLRSGKKDHPAVIADETILSYLDLDNRANQLARYLRRQGVQSGDRVGLLFDKSFHTYVALLAVLKLNAAYVPLDTGFPKKRIGYIVNDANVGKILTLSLFKSHFDGISAGLILLDEIEAAVAVESPARLSQAEKGIPQNQLSYIIYTSGSTGNPKGVAIEHPSICNFVKVAREVYGITEDDRVYQGMTIAFDFSVEELWVPLVAGATLIPGKPDTRLVGKDLAEFLRTNQVTVLCCVPTLLATVEEDLPELRFLLVSGEACPHDLVVRWYRPGRTILNAYGPTEATVTATWTELHPQRPVTIGQPLPTYTVVILSKHEDALLPKGEVGEIGIAGIGLAKGYVNLEERTRRNFIPDFLHIENNVSQRIYRTGDLGYINEDDEIEYHGRIDTQVKIRGYRIELTEIESVLLQIPQIAQAVVDTYSPEPGVQELVAYYTLSDDATELPLAEVSRTLRNRLPGYMIPTYLEALAVIPMLPSDKADRKSLPAPKGPRFVGSSGKFQAPETELEKTLADTLADVLKVDRVSIMDNFFDDLGGHSLLMARFSAEVRQRCNLEVSMRDIYQHPTVAQLAKRLSAEPSGQASTRNSEHYRVASDLEYYGCGALQLLYFLTYPMLSLAVVLEGVIWIASATHVLDTYVRAVGFSLFIFTLLTVLPIVAKWVVIGRWTKQKIPIWGRGYFRFWLVKQLTTTSPMVLFKGSPLFNVYLRLLGAKIGRNVVIYSRLTPVCTDLFTIGDNSILRKDSMLQGYKAQSGYIHTGPVSIGQNAFIGEAAVLDIDTALGDHSQLGHTSSLHAGQCVPAGEHYHGSPAERTETDYCPMKRQRCSNSRKIVYSLYQLLSLFFITAFLPFAAVYLWETYGVHLTKSPDAVIQALLPLSFGIFTAGLLLTLFINAAIPRLLSVFLRPDTIYPLYGFHYVVFRTISRLSNSQFYNHVFGDSSYVIYYLKLIGYKFTRIVQTGSNFGTSQKHDNPFLCEIGIGTIISDGLSMINTQVSSSSFKMSRVSIGDFSYLGNDILYPADARVGKNCLLATKVMIPLDGAVRENTGLLGSPCFEIPRVTRRDERIANIDETMKKIRIKQKNRSNIITAAGFLFFQWLFLFIIITMFTFGGRVTYNAYGIFGLLVVTAAAFLTMIEYYVLTDRIGRGFKKLKPSVCSIYEPYYWNVIERFWKIGWQLIQRLLTGTPFKTVIGRQLGAKVGKKVFDDGLHMTEPTLVEIGNYCTINQATMLQSHSLEEGVFKSDHIKIGKGCTIGIHAFVHYGMVMGDNSILDADSFLMKGEVLEPASIWRGNPAKAR